MTLHLNLFLFFYIASNIAAKRLPKRTRENTVSMNSHLTCDRRKQKIEWHYTFKPLRANLGRG